MRILVVGKGAVGGYFGARLQEAGVDVTFLVRTKSNRLVLQSVHGNLDLDIQSIVAGDPADPFDLVLLSVKAYHLEQAIQDIQSYVTEKTTILPLLNGVHHLNMLSEIFPNTLGGICFIESTVSFEGVIIQTSKRHDIVFGELNGEITERVERIKDVFSQAHFKTVATDDIQTAMWNKYVMITGLSGITTLMYSSLGAIQESPYGKEIYLEFLSELHSIAKAEGMSVYPPEKNYEIAMAMGPGMKASMLRDMEKGLPIEVDHLQGQFLKLAMKYNIDAPNLKLIYNRLKIYEMNR